jgi:hypothetical protein
LKAKEGNSGATPQQRAFARERAPRELRVKTRRVVIQPGDESTWLTSSRVILGFPGALPKKRDIQFSAERLSCVVNG